MPNSFSVGGVLSCLKATIAPFPRAEFWYRFLHSPKLALHWQPVSESGSWAETQPFWTLRTQQFKEIAPCTGLLDRTSGCRKNVIGIGADEPNRADHQD